MKTNLVIIPTRSRPHNAERAFAALREHSVISDFVMGLDDDDAHNYPEIDGVIREVNQRLWVNGTLNLLASKYQDKYETITFLGDDHLVRTKEWDEKLYEPIKAKGYGMSYGNDLFQGRNLSTMVMMSTNICKALGFFSPPKLKHLYIDNFWLAMGMCLDALNYFDDVIIEHLHYMANKAPVDDLYKEVNSPEMGTRDSQIFLDYVAEELKYDAIKVLKAVLT